MKNRERFLLRAQHLKVFLKAREKLLNLCLDLMPESSL